MFSLDKCNSMEKLRMQEYAQMNRPYIAVFTINPADFPEARELEQRGIRFAAKLYDGEFYTGFHGLGRTEDEIHRMVERQFPEMKKTAPGADDPGSLVCVYM